MIGLFVNDELRMMCKKTIMVSFKTLPWHLSGEIEENHAKSVKISSFQIEILTRGLQLCGVLITLPRQ
jgi:hypothetical protein